MASASPQQPAARETAADEEEDAQPQVEQVARLALLLLSRALLHSQHTCTGNT